MEATAGELERLVVGRGLASREQVAAAAGGAADALALGQALVRARLLGPAELAGLLGEVSGAGAGAGGGEGEDRVGPYVLGPEIGRGGMAVVRRAMHSGLRRPAAVKLLRGGAAASEERRVRFRREAEAAARLRHEAIVPVHDVGEWRGTPWLAMDLVEGDTLDRWIARERPTPREVARLLRPLCDALAHAHSHGIVHRDVKPRNILVGTGRAYLTDFGLAKLLPSADGPAEESPITHEGALVGSPLYMAPEQIRRGFGDVGPRADLFAYGCVLWEACEGRHPFAGAATPLEAFHRICEEEPGAPARLPRGLEAVCRRALRKSPEERFADAAGMGRALDAALAEGAGPPARRVRRRLAAAAAPLAIAAGALAFGLAAPGDASETRRLAAEAQAHRAAGRTAEAAEVECRLAWRLLDEGPGRDPAAAEDAARRAVGLAPDRWKCHGALGRVLAERGRPAEAATAYRTAIALMRAARESPHEYAALLRRCEAAAREEKP
ncbi:MAG: serine/threonine protein kinase [Planctomycetales bacterium]|nr:serine/threonine protein kinase [Planctomycetales bacterium]